MIMGSVWRAYRRRRPTTQALIAGAVLLAAGATFVGEPPAAPRELVIEGPAEAAAEEALPPRSTIVEVTTPRASPSTTEVEAVRSSGADGPGGELTSVTKHVDGDTLWVGGNEKVRFIGMDTPETTNGRRDCYGPEASARTAELLPVGTEVRLVYDAGRQDRYGRLLAYVYRASDGLFVNASLLRDGYAQVMTVPPNVAHVEEFVALQREARDAGRGFWGACRGGGASDGTVTPATTTAPITAPVAPVRPLAAPACHPSYRRTCIPPDVSDADCAGGSGNGPYYVQEKDIEVVGPDPYRLDSNGDGLGCES